MMIFNRGIFFMLNVCLLKKKTQLLREYYTDNHRTMISFSQKSDFVFVVFRMLQAVTTKINFSFLGLEKKLPRISLPF